MKILAVKRRVVNVNRFKKVLEEEAFAIASGCMLFLGSIFSYGFFLAASEMDILFGVVFFILAIMSFGLAAHLISDGG